MIMRRMRTRGASAAAAAFARGKLVQVRFASDVAALASKDRFAPRHIGPRAADLPAMLKTVGVESMEELISKTVPASIRASKELDLGNPFETKNAHPHIQKC